MGITQADISVKKKLELSPESWKLNGKIFLEFFWSDLGVKNYLDRLQKRTKQETDEIVR